MTGNNFGELRIWQRARAQAIALHDPSGGHSPAGGDSAFRGRIRGCAVSVIHNIAEGFERRSDEDFAHFHKIAKGSNGEVRSMLHLAEDRNHLASEIAAEMRSFAESLGEGIESLARHPRID